VAARFQIGVDLGGTKLIAGAVDQENNVLRRSYRQVLGLDTEQLIDAIVAAVEEIMAEESQRGGEVESVGFGIPALVDRRSETAATSVHLPLRDLDFARLMRERLNLSVALDNDGNCGALAEARAGAGWGVEVMVFLGLGTGVASGLAIDGELFRGRDGMAPEIGHMVVDSEGLRCHGDCPNRGCLETLASGTALIREATIAASHHPESAVAANLREGEEVTGPLITRLALAGDPVALSAFDKVARGLGIGMANVINIFNPELVVIGGGVSSAGELLLGPAREVMRERALTPMVDRVEVVRAKFGEEAGMVGAALLAREEAR
jgi:glucokinase